MDCFLKSERDTFEEAVANIREAIELYLEPDEAELFEYIGAYDTNGLTF